MLLPDYLAPKNRMTVEAKWSANNAGIVEQVGRF